MKKPYLIQRAKVDQSTAFNSGMKTGGYLSLDYMGSSEFEWGAVPKFQREVFAKLGSLIEYTICHNDVRLYFLAEPHQAEEYRSILRDLIDDKISLKERSRITTTWKDDEFYPLTEIDVWFDLDNAIPFARRSETLDNLRITIPNSIRYMDEQKKKGG